MGGFGSAQTFGFTKRGVTWMTVGCNYGHLGTGCKAVEYEYGTIWAELIYFCLVGPFLAHGPRGFGMIGRN